MPEISYREVRFLANNSVVVKIDGDDSGFKKAMSGIGNVAKKGIGAAVKGITAASAAVVGLTATAVKGYAEYEQLVGGVDTLFKTSSKKVQENAAKAYKSAGLSANEYMETVTGFAASLKQSFADTEEGIEAAADAADQAVTDMADNSNKMGTSMEMIQYAYQGFAKQNYTMLDNLKLGYGGTKTEMERLLKDAQKLTGIKYDINNLADVYQAIHVIQEEMGITGTTAKEAASTISGSCNAMKASWKNLVVGIANGEADIDALMDNFIESVRNVGKNLLPVIKTALSGAGKFISKAADEIIPEFIDVLVSSLPDLIKAGADVLSALIKGIQKNKKKIAKAVVEVAKIILTTLKELIPEVIKVAGELIAELAREIGNAVPILKPFTEIIRIIAENLDALIPIIAGVVAGVVAFKAAMAIKAIIDGVTASMKALNIVMNSNPVVALASAIIGLGVAIAGLCSETEKETEAEKRHREAIEAHNEAVKESTDAIKERQKVMKKQASEGLSNVAYTKKLAKELLSLADAQGNVNEADRDRAKFIIGELNEALGTEYKLIDGCIYKHEELEKSIYDVIEAKRFEALMNAAQPYYEEAIANRGTLEANYAQAYSNAIPILENHNWLLQKAAEEKQKYMNMSVDYDNYDSVAAYEEQYRKWQDAIAAANIYYKTNQETIQSYYDAEKALIGNTAAITGMEEILTLVADGAMPEATEALEDFVGAAGAGTLGIQNFAKGSQQHLAQLGKNVTGKLIAYKAALADFAETGSDSARQMVISTRDELTGAVGEYTEAGGSLMNGVIKGFNAEGKVVNLDLNPLLDSVTELEGQVSDEASGLGDDFTAGYAEGILGGTKEVEAAASGIANYGLWNLQWTQRSNSPSKVTQGLGDDFSAGFALGITSGKSSVINAAIAIAKAGIEAAEDELGIHSPSRVARDRVGKMLTKGIAVGIKEGGEEVSEAFEKVLADLDLQKDLGVISDAEYYRELAALRDEYLKEGTEAWWEYTKEIIEYSNTLKEEFTDNVEELKDKAIDAYTELADKASEKMDEVYSRQEKFRKQLVDMSKIISEGTELDDWGNEKPTYSLTDWDKENAEVRAYNKTLENAGVKLKTAFGDDVEGYNELMQIIRDGGLEDGLKLAASIVFADDSEVQKYVDGWRENKKLTSDTASAHYVGEKQIIADEFSKDVIDLRAEFEAAFETLPEDFFAPLGESSASEFGEAFMTDLDEILKNAESEISIAIGNAFADVVSSGSGTNVTYNNTYIIQAAEGESTHSQLKSIQDEETMKRMRG